MNSEEKEKKELIELVKAVEDYHQHKRKKIFIRILLVISCIMLILITIFNK